MYQKAGYPAHDGQIRDQQSSMKRPGAASVTFEIQESPKIKIVGVDFTGAQAFSQKKLRKVIKTRQALDVLLDDPQRRFQGGTV